MSHVIDDKYKNAKNNTKRQKARGTGPLQLVLIRKQSGCLRVCVTFFLLPHRICRQSSYIYIVAGAASSLSSVDVLCIDAHT